MNSPGLKLQQRAPGFALVLVSLLSIFDRIQVLRTFSFRWTDEDQAVLWYVAKDFAAGHLHEPCFPGQAYGTPLEALLSAPLLWAQVPPWQALPIVSAILSLAPFLLLAGLAWRERSPLIAVGIAAAPLVLSNEYAMMSSMPRGFTPGLFTASIGLILLQSSAQSRVRLGALLLTLGIAFNQGMLLLAVPGGLAFLLAHRGDRPLRRSALQGLLIGGVFFISTLAFYLLNPAYSLHPSPKQGFNFFMLGKGLQKAGQFLSTPAPMGSLPLLCLLAVAMLAALAVSRNRIGLYVGLLLLLIVVLSLGMHKVHDGSGSIYFSYGRAFLSLPLAMAFVGVLLGRQIAPQSPVRSAVVVVLVLLVGGAALITKARALPGEAPRRGNGPGGAVEHMEVAVVRDACEQLATGAAKAQTELMAFESNRVLAYGCGAILYGRLATLYPQYERRTWRMQEEDSIPRDRMFWVMAGTSAPCERFAGSPAKCSLLELGRPVGLVEHAKGPIMPLLREVKARVRKF